MMMTRRWICCVAGLLTLAGVAGCGQSPEQLLDQARIALDNDMPDRAFDNAKQVLADDPENVDALLLKGEAQMRLSRLDDARQTIRHVLDNDAESIAAHQLMGEWALTKMEHLLDTRSLLTPADRHTQFDQAMALGEQQAQWLIGKLTNDSLQMRAELAETDARRMVAIINARRGKPTTFDLTPNDAATDDAATNDAATTAATTDDSTPDNGSAADNATTDSATTGDAAASPSADHAADDQTPTPAILKLSDDELQARIDARLDEAVGFLQTLTNDQPKRTVAVTLYMDLLTERRQWPDVWRLALRLAEETEVNARLVDRVVQALLAIPAELHSVPEQVELGRRLRGAIKDDERDSHYARFAAARLLMAEKNWLQADDLLQKMAKERSNDLYVQHARAYCLYQLKQYSQAEQMLFRLNNARQFAPVIQSLYGQTLLAQSKFEAAKLPLQNAVRLNPDDTGARVAYLQTLVRLGHMSEAEVDIERLYQQNPDDPQAIGFKAELERSYGHTQNVQNLMAQLEPMSPLTEVHLTALIDGYRYLGRFDKVEQYVRDLRALRPDVFEATIALGEALLAQDKLKEAFELLQQAQTSNGDDPRVLTLLGRYYLAVRDYQPAAAALQRVVAAQPRENAARNMYAHALAGQSRLDEALAQAELVLEQEPDNLAARDLAVRIYQLTGNPGRAAEHLQQIDASRLDEKTWPVLLALRRTSDDRLDDAAEICQRALTAGNDDPLIRMLLMSIYEQKNDFTRAQEQVTAFLHAQPDSMHAYVVFSEFFDHRDEIDAALKTLDEMAGVNQPLATLAKAWILIDHDRAFEAVDPLSAMLDRTIAAKDRMALTFARTLAGCYEKRGDLPSALATYDRLIQAGLAADEADVARIELLIDHDRTDEAGAQLAALIGRLRPDPQGPALDVIRLMVRLDQGEQAHTLIDQWIAQDQRQPAYIYWKAQMLQLLGRAQDAAAAYRRVIALRADDLDAHRGLAASLLQARDYPAVEAAFGHMADVGRDGQIESVTGLAHLYLMLGLRDNALGALEKLEQIAPPRDARVLLAIAQAYNELDMPREAYDRLEQIQRIAPEHGAAQAMMARIDLQQDRVDQAGQKLRDLAQNPRTAPSVIPVMMGLRADQPATQDLVRWYDGAIDVAQLGEADRRQWLTIRLYTYAQQREWTAALATAQELAEALSQGSPAASPEASRMAAGMFALYIQLNQPDQARRIYQEQPALAASPDGPLAALLIDQPQADGAQAPPLGQYLIAMSRGDLAAASQAAQDLEPQQTIYRGDLMQALEAAQGGSAASMDAYRQLVLALLASDGGVPQLGEQICRQVIAAEPVAPAFGMLLALTDELPGSSLAPIGVTLYHEAVVKQRSGDHVGAVGDLQTLVQREPDNTLLQYSLAQAYEAAGQFDLAEPIERQLWQTPGPLKSRVGNDLAYLLAEHRSDRLDEAYQIAQQIAQTDPDGDVRSFLLDTLGWIEHKRGDNQSALTHLQEAIPDLRDLPEAHRHIAEVYQALGNNVWARYHLTQAAGGAALEPGVGSQKSQDGSQESGVGSQESK